MTPVNDIRSPTSSEVDVDADRITSELMGVDAGTDPFVAAVRATRMPMIITNPRLTDNPVVFVNDAFCRLTGYERSEILGRNCRFLQGEDTDLETVKKIREAVDAISSIEIDVRNYRKDGTPFWNRLLLAPVHDLEGNLSYFFASQMDVTLEKERLFHLEAKNAALVEELAEQLRRQHLIQEQLYFALEAGRFGSWSLDLESGNLETSPTCRKNFGRDPSRTFSYEELRDAVHPLDQARMQEAVARSVETGSDYDIEYRIVTPEGETRWVAIRGHSYRGGVGEPGLMAGVSLDITGRKRDEQMREAILRLSDAFRNSRSEIDITHASARVLLDVLPIAHVSYAVANPVIGSLEMVCDWGESQGEGPVGSYAFPEADALINALIHHRYLFVDKAESGATGNHWTQPFWKPRTESLLALPMGVSSRNKRLLVLARVQERPWEAEELQFAREVAERTQVAIDRHDAEQALNNLNATLETAVVERTRELLSAQEALVQAQKMEAVGQLTGGLAHDFNNLLTAIGGSLEMIQVSASAGRLDAISRFHDIANGALKRAGALTHRLLAFSRRQALDPKPTHINQLISGMSELVQRTIGPAIELRFIEETRLWMTRIDQHQLENALLNLCINARDAMGASGVLIIQTKNKSLSASKGSRDGLSGDFVVMSVSDNGAGMPPDVIARAFDPFFTTKPTGEGTGLGLSMVYGFSRQSGGDVHITSEVGTGTTVSLYLPRDRDAGAPVLESDSGEQTIHGIQRGVVLIIDDEPSIRLLVSEFLNREGYQSIEASDGASGLSILMSEARVDLLITDIGLPGALSGKDVAVKARKTRPGLKILFITGYDTDTEMDVGLSDTQTVVLTKPFRLDVLEREVNRLLSLT